MRAVLIKGLSLYLLLSVGTGCAQFFFVSLVSHRLFLEEGSDLYPALKIVDDFFSNDFSDFFYPNDILVIIEVLYRKIDHCLEGSEVWDRKLDPVAMITSHTTTKPSQQSSRSHQPQVERSLRFAICDRSTHSFRTEMWPRPLTFF